jgi:cytoskeleton protein RodZ
VSEGEILEQILDPAMAEVGGPGRRLREAREACRWTREDVASQLRLPAAVIGALERDDYKSLPPPAYVRGYLRSYARLLDLPEAMVSEAYQSLQIVVPGREPASLRTGRQATSRDRRVRWFTYLLTVVLIALPVIWWQTQGSFRFWETSPADAGPALLNPLVPTEEPRAATTSQTPQPDTAASTAVPEDTAPTVDENELAAVETAELATDHEVSGDAASAAQPGPTHPAPAKPRAAAVTSSATAPTVQLDVLTLRARSGSWVSVRDADGKRLMYRVISRGGVKTLKGRAPFQVVLGNPHDVSVEYNGKPVDSQRYARDGVTRFEVGSGHE